MKETIMEQVSRVRMTGPLAPYRDALWAELLTADSELIEVEGRR